MPPTRFSHEASARARPPLAYVRAEDVVRSREVGFSHHLVKPVDAEMLIEAMLT